MPATNEAEQTSQKTGKPDKFIFWPLGVFCCITFGPIVGGEFWQLDDILFTVAAWAASVLIWFVFALVALWDWHWRKLISVATAPFLVVGAIAIQLYFGFDAKWNKFQIMRLYYIWSVDGLTEAQFEWPEHGVFLGGGWNETLIYDVIDRVGSAAKDESSLAKHPGDVIHVRDMGGYLSRNSLLRTLILQLELRQHQA